MTHSNQSRLDSLLHQAVHQRNLGAAQQALDDGADPNNGLEPDSVLMRAVDGDCTFLDTPELTTLIELLLSRGADPNGQIPDRDPTEAPIHTAAGFGMVEAVRSLHRGGADLNRLSLEEYKTALSTAESEHSFRGGAWFGDDYFGEVLPRALGGIPIRFRHPGSEDINARVVHWLWGMQQVIPYLRSNGGLMEWELLPRTADLIDAVCFTPESPCRYYRPGRFQAGRHDRPVAPEAFGAVPGPVQDDYEGWCAEFIDPWLHGPGSLQVLAFDYDEHVNRGLRILTEFMTRLAMPDLRASISLHSSAAIAAGCHLRDCYDWSWAKRAFVRSRSWQDNTVRSLLDVD